MTLNSSIFVAIEAAIVVSGSFGHFDTSHVGFCFGSCANDEAFDSGSSSCARRPLRVG